MGRQENERMSPKERIAFNSGSAPMTVLRCIAPGSQPLCQTGRSDLMMSPQSGLTPLKEQGHHSPEFYVMCVCSELSEKQLFLLTNCQNVTQVVGC